MPEDCRPQLDATMRGSPSLTFSSKGTEGGLRGHEVHKDWCLLSCCIIVIVGWPVAFSPVLLSFTGFTVGTPGILLFHLLDTAGSYSPSLVYFVSSLLCPGVREV